MTPRKRASRPGVRSTGGDAEARRGAARAGHDVSRRASRATGPPGVAKGARHAPASRGEARTDSSADEPRSDSRPRAGEAGSSARRIPGANGARREPLLDRLAEEWGYAEDVVARARRLGADASEVFLQSGRGVNLDLEANEITSLGASEEWGVGVRVAKGRGLGFAYFTRPGKRDEAIRDALRAARLVERKDLTFSPGGRYPMGAGGADKRIAGLGADEAPAMAKRLVDAALSVSGKVQVAGGGIGWGEDLYAVVTSEGASIADWGTAAGAAAYVVFKGRAASTGFEGFESNRLDFDVAAAGRAAAELARDSQGGKRWGKPRKTTVLMRPEAAAQLLEYVTLPALQGDKVGRGESFYAGRMGERVASKGFTILDDPSRGGALGGAPSDDEGEPSRTVRLIEDGTLKGHAYDRGAAAEYAGKPTGSGLRYGGLSDSTTYKEPPRTGIRHAVVEGRQERKRLDSLIGAIDDGILVHDLLGAHTANTASGDFSVSSSLSFRIEKGEVTGPLKTIMLAGNFFETVRNVEALGGWRRQTSGHFSPVCFDLPWVAYGGVGVVGQ